MSAGDYAWARLGRQAWALTRWNQIVGVLYWSAPDVGEGEDAEPVITPAGFYLVPGGDAKGHVCVLAGAELEEWPQALAAAEGLVAAPKEGLVSKEYLVSRYSLLACQLLRVIDAGGVVTRDETNDWINDRTLFDRLIERLAIHPYEFDVSGHDGMEREFVMHMFERLYQSDVPYEYGVETNGLAALLACCIEVLRHPASYQETN